MAQSLNKVLLLGRVGREPEMKFAQVSICRFSVATSESYKDRTTGEWKETTEWHNVVIFGPAADAAKERIHKGDLVFVEGKITNRSWVDQSGQKRYSTEIRADRIQPIGSRSEHSGAQAGYQDQYSEQGQQWVNQPPKPPIGQGGIGSQAANRYNQGGGASNNPNLGSSSDPNYSHVEPIQSIKYEDDYSEQDYGDPISNYNGIDQRSKLDE